MIGCGKYIYIDFNWILDQVPLHQSRVHGVVLLRPLNVAMIQWPCRIKIDLTHYNPVMTCCAIMSMYILNGRMVITAMSNGRQSWPPGDVLSTVTLHWLDRRIECSRSSRADPFKGREDEDCNDVGLTLDSSRGPHSVLLFSLTRNIFCVVGHAYKNPVAPIEGLGGRRPPPRFSQNFFIGFIDSMFNICTWISSFSTF